MEKDQRSSELIGKAINVFGEINTLIKEYESATMAIATVYVIGLAVLQPTVIASALALIPIFLVIFITMINDNRRKVHISIMDVINQLLDDVINMWQSIKELSMATRLVIIVTAFVVKFGDMFDMALAFMGSIVILEFLVFGWNSLVTVLTTSVDENVADTTADESEEDKPSSDDSLEDDQDFVDAIEAK